LTYAEDGELGVPLPGIIDLIKILKQTGWLIIIWTCREITPDLRGKLIQRGIPFDYINFNPYGADKTSNKIMADVYLDDRAINFDGQVQGLLQKIQTFQPWHKR
jgi:hypothetical protein